MSTDIEYFEITNSCICIDEHDDPNNCCDGDCWEERLAQFSGEVRGLFKQNDSGVWRVEGFPLWNGNVDGFAHALTPRKLLNQITVQGEWRLRYAVEGDTLKAVISHHDVPTGRSFTVSIHKEEEQS